MQKPKTAATLLAALFLTASLSVPAEAVSPNPFAHQQYLTLDGAEEQAYITQRAQELYGGGELANKTIRTGYVADAAWHYETVSLGGVTTDVFTPQKHGTDQVVLFLHGGAYLGGQNNLYRDWGLYLAMLAGNAKMYMPDYRLSPKFHYPAAREDAAAVYQELLESGIPAEKIIVIGDSAGCHLALVLLEQLKANGTKLPGRMVLISPWADIGITLPSRTRNLGKDQVLNPQNAVLLEILKNPPYFSGEDPLDPQVSPIYMDMQGLPPTLITAGTSELLLDDALLLHGYMQSAGVDVTLKLYQDMSHDWTIMLPELKETQAMFEDIRIFLKEGTH